MPQGDELGYGNIYGAGVGGGQNLESIVDFLFSGLSNAGWFGEGGEGINYEGTIWGDPESQYWDAGGYNVQSIQDLLGNAGFMQEGYVPDASFSEEYIGGMGGFQELLQSLKLGERSSEYGQNIGDIRSEIGAQMGALRKNYPTTQKGSRYGGLGGASRKNLGGSRQDYMSDIYGLEKQQQKMTADFQEDYESDFYTDVTQWMTDNTAPTYGG